MKYRNLTTDLEAARIPQVETEMSRRYLKMVERWVPTAMSYFDDWPGRPNCGHFYGGTHWFGIETAVQLYALAVLSTSPEYDERATGLPITDLRDIVIKSIRYLCFTHDTGPEDCVRPNGGFGRPDTWNTKWGERGKGFFNESQCGPTIGNMTAASLMLRPHMDDETWGMLGAICLDYLGRFGEMTPRSGVYADTQMEENAWTAHGLAASYLFLSGHEKSADWEDSTKRWMFSVCAAPQDRFDYGEVVKGSTASQLTGKTFTMLPDYMAENHGMVHPGYTASGVASLGTLAMLYRMHGRVEPPHAYWNRQEVYNRIKLLSDGTGTSMPTQGMDRLYLGERRNDGDGYSCGAIHAVAFLFLKDPDAGYFERLALELREKTQAGYAGRLVDPDIIQNCHELEDSMEIKESEFIAGIVRPYLMHRIVGEETPRPSAAEEVASVLNGVRVFPHSGFIHHRHEKGQTAFSWRNYVTALPFTTDGVLTIGPSRRSMLANFSVKGMPDSHHLRTLRVNQKDDGFVALLSIDRAQDSIRQNVLLASLPDGRTMCRELLRALRQCEIEGVEQGFLEVTNEDFPLVDAGCDGRRVLFHPRGEVAFKGFPSNDPNDDIVLNLDHPAWLNIDDEMGLVFQGTGKTRYLNRHYYPPYQFRGIVDELTLSSREEAMQFMPGDAVAELATLIIPGQNHAETPGSRLQVAESTVDTVCMVVDGFLCAGNFGSKRRMCSFETSFVGPIPIFEGMARVGLHGVEYMITLDSREAMYVHQVMEVVPDGIVTIEAVAGGSVYVTNEEAREVRLKIEREGTCESVVLEASATIRL
jgi:hypothetical protein